MFVFSYLCCSWLFPFATCSNTKVLYSLLTGDTSYSRKRAVPLMSEDTPKLLIAARLGDEFDNHLQSCGKCRGAIVQSSQVPANRDLDSPCHIDNDNGDVCGRLDLPVQASPAPLSRKHRTVSGTHLKGFEVVSERVLWSSRCPRRAATGVQAR